MRVLAAVLREALLFASAAAAASFAGVEPVRAGLVGLMVWIFSGLHRGGTGPVKAGPALHQWPSTLPE